MLRFVADREVGRVLPAQLCLAERTRRTFAIDLATTRLQSPHRQAVQTVDIDAVSGRLYARTHPCGGAASHPQLTPALVGDVAVGARDAQNPRG